MTAKLEKLSRDLAELRSAMLPHVTRAEIVGLYHKRVGGKELTPAEQERLALWHEQPATPCGYWTGETLAERLERFRIRVMGR